MRTKLGNFALALCSSLVGVMLAEIAIRLVAPQPMNGTVFEYSPRGYRVIKSTGTSIFSIGDRRGVYYFTPPHLRAKRAPAAGAERILVLGDSFTFGVGLAEEETYVAKLQAKIDAAFGSDRVALLNAGIGGSGTADHLAFMEDFGRQIAPRAILVFVSIDDFGRAERSPLYRLRDDNTLELDEGHEQTGRLKRFIAGSQFYNFLIEHLHVAQLTKKAVINATFRSDALAASTASNTEIAANTYNQQKLARALFFRMKAWCDANKIEFAVINNGWWSYPWLSELLAAGLIPTFDAAPQIQPILAREPGLYTIRGDGHPNPNGATLIAEAVWPFLQSFIKDGKLHKGGGKL